MQAVNVISLRPLIVIEASGREEGHVARRVLVDDIEKRRRLRFAVATPFGPQVEHDWLAAQVLARAVEVRRLAANEADLVPTLLYSGTDGQRGRRVLFNSSSRKRRASFFPLRASWIWASTSMAVAWP